MGLAVSLPGIRTEQLAIRLRIDPKICFFFGVKILERQLECLHVGLAVNIHRHADNPSVPSNLDEVGPEDEEHVTHMKGVDWVNKRADIRCAVGNETYGVLRECARREHTERGADGCVIDTFAREALEQRVDFLNVNLLHHRSLPNTGRSRYCTCFQEHSFDIQNHIPENC